MFGQGAPAENQPMLAQTPPSAVSRLADLQMPMSMDILFFMSGLCVVFAGVLSIVSVALTEFAPFELVDSIYLLLFGTMMAVLDAPFRIFGGLDGIGFMRKYFLFATRFVGRGIFYVFLGTMVFATLWDNDIWPVGAVVLGTYVFLVGIFSAVMGVMKSNKLERVRVVIKKQNANSEQVFTSFARANPNAGMTADEFNVMCGQVAGVGFRNDEMAFVMNAICNTPQQTIPLKDFHEWISNQSTTIL